VSLLQNNVKHTSLLHYGIKYDLRKIYNDRSRYLTNLVEGIDGAEEREDAGVIPAVGDVQSTDES
jgi:hypothetical protein